MHPTTTKGVTHRSLKLNFGYSWVWMYGHLVVMVPFLVAAGVAWLLGAPNWGTAVLLILVGWALIGFLIMQFMSGFNSLPTLPTQDFLPEGTGSVLDLGCGLGRATIMVALARPGAHITALDKFSATYITDHGEESLSKNLRLAGVENQVTVKRGDLLALPFEDESFDALVSAFAIDHTSDLALALSEAKRVLRSGGKFLLLTTVPSIAMGIALAPFYARSWNRLRWRDDWRRDVGSAGFDIDSEGRVRHAVWFLLSRKSASG